MHSFIISVKKIPDYSVEQDNNDMLDSHELDREKTRKIDRVVT